MIAEPRNGNGHKSRLGHPEHYDAAWLAGAHQRARLALSRLHPWLAEFIIFGFKQAWACLFGGLMLGMILVTKWLWTPAMPIHRYDFLFLAALAIQAALIATKLEEWKEVRVILVFHVVGTAMELFKTAMGSWTYPEPAFFRVGGVPLFSGFMYACVGSYIARATRVLDIRYENYPPIAATWLLAVAIYLNFFTHHYVLDLRLGLFAATILLFWRTRVWFLVDSIPRFMPMLVGFLLVSFFIWIAENIGTITGTWLYPDQKIWRPVSLHKLGAWYLLMIISFVLTNLVHHPRPLPYPGTGALHPAAKG